MILTKSLSISMSSNPVWGNVSHPTSYAQAAPTPSNNVQPQPFKQLSQQPYDRSHESNAIIFGVPEGRSIIDSKALVDEIFEFWLVGQSQSMIFST